MHNLRQFVVVSEHKTKLTSTIIGRHNKASEAFANADHTATDTVYSVGVYELLYVGGEGKAKGIK